MKKLIFFFIFTGIIFLFLGLYFQYISLSHMEISSKLMTCGYSFKEENLTCSCLKDINFPIFNFGESAEVEKGTKEYILKRCGR